MNSHYESKHADCGEVDRLTTAVSAYDLTTDTDCVERHRRVKTEFCPVVTGFCPRLSQILSWSDRFVSQSALNSGDRTLRTGSKYSSKHQVKSHSDSGAVSSVVLLHAVHAAPVSRASQKGTSIRFGAGESSSIYSGSRGAGRGYDQCREQQGWMAGA